jgi:Ti-type conjugative transfer relaxase TraA
VAIQYIRVEVVHAGPDSSATGLGAYISRELRIEKQTGRVYDFRAKGNDLLARAIELPDDAPEWARKATGGELWNRAYDAEMLKDGSRIRSGAQLAYSAVVALPKECSLEQNVELLRGWIASEYTSKGLAVEWAIHAPDKGSPDNFHGHVLISTRALAEEGFGAKVRGALGCSFGRGGLVAGDDLGRRWRAYQEAYFAGRGIEVAVDPLAAVPQIHAPREVVEGRARSPYGRLVAEENTRRAEESRELVRDPENLLELVTETNAVFTARTLEVTLRKAGIESEDAALIRDAALARSIALADREGREGYYTTPSVLASESLTINLAVAVAQREHAGMPRYDQIERAVENAGLDAEQRTAVGRATVRGPRHGLTIWRGVAGAGKSRAANAAREAFEEAGWRVIGAAPTNTVARDLEGSGFREGTTIARLLWRLDEGRDRLDTKTLVVVDEAAMVSTADYRRLLGHAWKSGSRVLLVGDDRQLGSVSRGGMFRAMVETVGCEELVTVRRQREEAQREATRLLAAGEFGDALRIYEGLGAVRFEATGEEAARRLVTDWGTEARRVPEGVRFVYARTNAEVAGLNLALAEEAHWLGLSRGEAATYEAERGDVRLRAGDRIQFRANDRRLELYNGTCGTVLAATRKRLEVRLDSGREVAFDPREYRDFQLGYAGTVYRGQGKTQTTVFALHGTYSDAASAYVQMTRHTADLRIYAGREATPDLEAMARQMGRPAKLGAAILYRPAGGGRTYLDQALGLPELEVKAEPERAPEASAVREDVAISTPIQAAGPEPSVTATAGAVGTMPAAPEPAAPAVSVEEAVREAWQELRLAVKDDRELARQEAAYREDVTARLLASTERATTEDGQLLRKAFGRDDEAARGAVAQALSEEVWDRSEPVPGHRPRLLAGSAYRSLLEAIRRGRQVWRETALRRIEGLVRDQFASKRKESAKRVAGASRKLLERVDEVCKPEDHQVVATLAEAARKVDERLAGELAARAERLRQWDPVLLAARRERLVAAVRRSYGEDASDSPSGAELGRALEKWVKSAAPEKLPAEHQEHAGMVFLKAVEAARKDPTDEPARRVVSAQESHERAQQREISRGGHGISW